jgi:hypothetical protein
MTRSPVAIQDDEDEDNSNVADVVDVSTLPPG